jgi:hypothetical protein
VVPRARRRRQRGRGHGARGGRAARPRAGGARQPRATALVRTPECGEIPRARLPRLGPRGLGRRPRLRQARAGTARIARFRCTALPLASGAGGGRVRGDRAPEGRRRSTRAPDVESRSWSGTGRLDRATGRSVRRAPPDLSRRAGGGRLPGRGRPRALAGPARAVSAAAGSRVSPAVRRGRRARARAVRHRRAPRSKLLRRFRAPRGARWSRYLGGNLQLEEPARLR